MNREPNEISEDEYLDRIQRNPARWEQAHDMADLIHDRQVEDALLDFDDDRRNEGVHPALRRVINSIR